MKAIIKLREECEDVLDAQFPKGECKERGHALVLFAEMWIRIEKLYKSTHYIPGKINGYPALVYLNEDFRENYFKGMNSMTSMRSNTGITQKGITPKPAEVVILDDNPISIGMYMEEHPEAFEEEELKSIETNDKEEKMTAQEVIDWCVKG